ncbi:class I SAM-dependent methyltransferase [Ferrimicrobium sp.]|uniref:class I SAM-dependent methyltransferase n=1 Tax=Ferrimicrobium sp. TaxID=2926050 RepID=UPI00262F9A56|nr:class I SAM-dependent methyltransferase [Ferrimicrobium sp.]
MDLEEFRALPEWPLILRDSWETNARWWQAGFTEGGDAEYEEQIKPIVREGLCGARRVLDLGGGEGQLARVLARDGADVVVLDSSHAQLVMAHERGSTGVLGTGGSLPFVTGCFDAVLICLVLEHVVELDEVFAEVARVLAKGGRFLLLLNHPILQTPGSGFIDDVELGEQYWRLGPYLHQDIQMEEVDASVFVPFVHRPLSEYVNRASAQGLALVHMQEPAPPPGFLARAVEYQEVQAYPRLLVLHFERRS